MRKLSAAFLVILFSLSLLTPLLASAPEDNLPACCRRDGKHACAMRKAAAAPKPGPGFSAKPDLCSQYPLAHATPVPPLALADAPSPRHVATLSAPLTPTATQSPATTAFSSSSPRAPPASR